MTLTPNNTTLVAVESILCAGFVILLAFAIILYINRRSYKVLLLLWSQLACLVPKTLSNKDGVKKTLKDVSDKAAVDLLVSGLIGFTIFRAATGAFRIGIFATRVSDEVHNRYVELISAGLFMLGFALYNILFVSLAWLWLNVALVLFTKSQKKVLSWTIGILLSASVVLMVVPIAVIITLNLIPEFKYGSLNRVYVISIIVAAPVFFISQIILTVIVVALAIKICILMRIPSERSNIENKDEERKMKTVIRKVTIALFCFVAALILRGVGLGAVLFRDSIPTWAINVFFMGLPEFTGCIAVVYVLWPYTCSCRKGPSNSKSLNQDLPTKAIDQRFSEITYSTPSTTPSTPEALSQAPLIVEAQTDSHMIVVAPST